MIGRNFRKLRDTAWLPAALSVLGLVLYLVQAWAYAHIQTSFVDEGWYLYIGNLFARGVLQPFQDYTVPRLYAPLAYLIPGLVEKWFGAGLRTGRYFSVFCSLLMLLALWLTARRFSGNWGGTVLIWAMALTPVSVQVYSLAISEALVACLLAWSLFFLLDDRRPLWQIVIGASLAGFMVMTRQNLIPFIPLLIAYVFWQHGKKAGLWALAGCSLPILVAHIPYWPNILQIWATWLPPKLTPFLDAFRFPPANLVTGTNTDLSSRLLAFLQGFRFHYFTLFGFIICISLWPCRGDWKSQTDRRTAYFLAASFLVLTLIHLWGTNNSINQCMFCFTPYLAFFDITALLLVIISFSTWKRQVSKMAGAVIAIFIPLFSTGLGYATFDKFGPWVLGVQFPAFTRGLDPRKWVPFISLWDILANKYHLDYWESRVPVSTIAAFLAGLVFLLLGRLVYTRWQNSKRMNAHSFSAFILVALLGSGVLLSPLMGGTYRQDGICRADILQTYEQIGGSLSNIIPSGSQVYWDAGTAVPLLYLPGAKVFLPQVYGVYGYRLGGDPERLLQYGLWNEETARQWLKKADFIVLGSGEDLLYNPGGILKAAQFQTFHTIPTNPCKPDSTLSIYRRIP